MRVSESWGEIRNNSNEGLGSEEEEVIQVPYLDTGCGEFPDIEKMKVRLTQQFFYFGQKTLKH